MTSHQSWELIRPESRAYTHQDTCGTETWDERGQSHLSLRNLESGSWEMTPVGSRDRRRKVMLRARSCSAGWGGLVGWAKVREAGWETERESAGGGMSREEQWCFDLRIFEWEIERKASISDGFYVPAPMKLSFSDACEAPCIPAIIPLSLVWLEGISTLCRESAMPSRKQAVAKLC